MLRIRIKPRPRKMSGLEGPGSGPEGRLKRLRKHVTSLFRHERIESSYAQCQETRGYAEKLISMAIRNGDRHKHTMEMADYWLLEKDMIHKLFKVLVPRYKSLPAAATSIHRVSTLYPGMGSPEGVLELKGNSWPPMQPTPRDTHLQLHNILLEEARHEFYREQRARAKPYSGGRGGAASHSAQPGAPQGSSVDAQPTGQHEEGGAGSGHAAQVGQPSQGHTPDGSSVDGRPTV